MDPMALHRAAEEGDLHWVRQLVEAGASVDSRDDRGLTPPLSAASCGHHAVVDFLISRNPKNHKPLTLLDVENEGATCIFFHHDEINYTLLHFASVNGWADIAQIIIEKGSESDVVNAATRNGVTPLIVAAVHGHEDVAALLLRSGADVNRREVKGLTALHCAARLSRVRLVKLLLQEEGLDLNPQDLDGQTPLHLACSLGDLHLGNCKEVIKQLLEAGANVNLNNIYSETPLGFFLGVVHNTSLEVINLYLQHGAFFQNDGAFFQYDFLMNVDLCTQSVVNKFSYQTLPALYSNPYFASMLPSMYNFILSTSQKDELKNFVRRDIQQNTFCNVVRVRPTALSALCVQCLAAYTASCQ